MEIKKQVCSLEQSQRLKDLGVTGRGYFHWYRTSHGDYVGNLDDVTNTYENNGWDIDDICFLSTAFTAAELLSMNHQTITINNLQCMNPGEALADHLLGRLERGEITAEEINIRLLNS